MRLSNKGLGALFVTGVVLCFLYVPLVVVVLFSFNKTSALSFPFGGFSTRWYSDVFSDPAFRQALVNSVIVASVCAGVTLIIGTPAAYGISRLSGRLRAPITFVLFGSLTLPGLFLGVALLVYFVRVHLTLSLTTVVIAHVVYVCPYYMLIARTALDRLNPAHAEIAADLGARPWVVFRKVTLPQVWPILAGATILAFALSFDEFVITFFVIGPQSTLPLYIWSRLRRVIDPSINVVSTILLSVTVLLWAVAFLVAFRGELRRRQAVADATETA